MNDLQKKPPRAKAPRPVESFGPEILSALMRGATEGLEFRTSYATAIRFRLRVHQLRESMRRSGHEKYELVCRVRVSIKWPNETPVTKLGRHNVPDDRSVECIVTLSPNDSEFSELLQAAGVDPLAGLDRSHLEDEIKTVQPSSRPLQDLEELLREIK